MPNRAARADKNTAVFSHLKLGGCSGQSQAPETIGSPERDFGARCACEVSSPRAEMSATQALLRPGNPSGESLAWTGLERAKGFEPSTPTLARLCSTPELRPRSDRRRPSTELPNPLQAGLSKPARVGRHKRTQTSSNAKRGPFGRTPAGSPYPRLTRKFDFQPRSARNAVSTFALSKPDIAPQSSPSARAAMMR